MSRILQMSALALLLLSWPLELSARLLWVPGQYRSIQSAVNAAGYGDTVIVSPGPHPGPLVMNKSIYIIGQGRSPSVIHAHMGEGAVITIHGARVTLSGIEVNGGRMVSPTNRYHSDPPGLYARTSTKGIVANNSKLVLRNVSVNNVRNYLVTIVRGTLIARNLRLSTRTYYRGQADVGLRIQASRAHITGLRQPSEYIDHTIDINDPGRSGPRWGRSDVTILQSQIRSSALSWGDCIRAYSNVSLTINSVYCYRTRGGQQPKKAGHTGFSLNGSNSQVLIKYSRFIHVPVGVNIHAGAGQSNRVRVEHCTFEDNPRAGILIHSMRYPGVDLGGGPLGSRGGNRFMRMPGYDVKLTRNSTVDIPAYGNYWSRQPPEHSIWDRNDDPAQGKVLWNRN